jgi:phosphatidylinositol alpha-mannosyltransferase
MRIALVCPYSLTVPGGVQSQVLGLARALRASGEEVAVVGPAESSGIAGRLDAAALEGAIFVKVGSGTPISANGSRAPVSPWPATMSRTLSALRAFSPDVVHVHEPFVPGPSLAAVARGPSPIVGTFHRSGNDLAYRAYGHLVGVWSRRLDAAFAVSEEARVTARACIGRIPADVGIIPNGVEARPLARLDPWPTDAPTVVFVGRHEQRKGLEVLLGAFGLLPATTRLWVLGEGPETERLKARSRAEERIEWLGAVDDSERARRLAGADVFVAPSLGGESFGLVLLEAMAAGTAVVASDLAGYRLAAAGAALFVPPGDAGALAGAVREVLENEAERRDLRARGLRRAEECDMSVIAGLYRDVYGRLGRAG